MSAASNPPLSSHSIVVQRDLATQEACSKGLPSFPTSFVGGGDVGLGGCAGRPLRGVPAMSQMCPSPQQLAGTPSSKISSASTDLVALARSCGAHHISLRGCPPSYGGLPGQQGHVFLAHRASPSGHNVFHRAIAPFPVVFHRAPFSPPGAALYPGVN
jgi:hypothetical protein